MCKVSTNLLFQATYNIKTEKQTINSTYLVSVRSGRLAEGKGLEIDVPSKMSRRLTIQDNELATVLSVYAPTLQAETGVKDTFYRDLHNLLQQVDSKDKLLILGDFRAKVGRDFELWKGVLGSACFWSSVLSISSSSPTLCSSRRIGSRQRGDTLQTLAPPGLRPDSAA